VRVRDGPRTCSTGSATPSARRGHCMQ
jgi:hypothetical protein